MRSRAVYFPLSCCFAKASTPFDKNRSGFVLGEGCGVLLLEEYEHAVARGAKIYCELAGYGATCDAYHMTSPAPEGEAAAKAMVNAYTEAGLQPSDITYINAHGTSTGLNDKYETRAIKIALGEEAAKTVKINSTKSMTGHMLGGTGAVEAIVSAMSVHENFLHQTIGYTHQTQNVIWITAPKHLWNAKSRLPSPTRWDSAVTMRPCALRSA